MDASAKLDESHTFIKMQERRQFTFSLSLSHTHFQIQFPLHNNKLYNFLSMYLVSKHCAKFLTYIISFNLGNKSEIWDFLVPFFR